jgi:hypothetical protein
MRSRRTQPSKALPCDQTEGLRMGGGMGELLFSKEDSIHPFFDSRGEKRQRM